MPGTATTILIDGTPTNGSDPWIDSLVAGGAWTDGNGGPVTIQWTAFQGTMNEHSSLSWTSLALAGLREAMALWESVANIDFVEVSGPANADVRFWWGTEAQAGGYGVLGWSDLPGFEGYYENPASETRDVLFNAQDSSMAGPLGKGSLGLVTMVHEIGHLLGLAHPHDGGPAADATNFHLVYNPNDIGNGGLNQGIHTAMSYNFGWPSKVPEHTAESWGWTYGPMALDIAAIQEIYGANTTHASGDNVYQLSTKTGPGTYWASIWDTGGTDTISAVGASSNTTIDLRAPRDALDGSVLASFSYYYGDTLGGYTIARGVVIENAIGGNSNDRLYGNEVSNRLEGGLGDDQLDGREGADTMLGGAGSDGYYVDNVGDVVVELANSGIDIVISSIDYTLGANLENLSLQGNWGPLKGTGNSAANVITGNEYDNILEGAGGADTVNGRDGDDWLVVRDLSFAKIEGGNGTDTLALDGAGLVLDLTNASMAAKLQTIERIDLTGTGDNTLLLDQWRVYSIGAVVGFKRVLIVEGNAGDKVTFFEPTWTSAESFINADGKLFDRWVLGNSEVQVERVLSPLGVTIVGTTGNDIISTTVSVPGQPVATAVGDTIDGRVGADMMSGGGGDDTYLVDNAGDQTIEAIGAGIDLVRSSISWTLADNVENLELLAGAASGTGNSLANTITGNVGDNMLDGGRNADTMIGGLGNDTYVVDNVGDIVVEGVDGGTDTVLLSITYSLPDNVENLTLTGSDSIYGFGNDLDNLLIGNAGISHLAGGNGNDTYVIDSTAHSIIENNAAGIDTVRASISYVLGPNLENLILTGTAAIEGTGNAFQNVLTGNAGNNVLDGGTAADTMAGGLGDDTYLVDVTGDVVTELAGEGTDTVNAWFGWTLGANFEHLRLMGTADLDGTGNTLNNMLWGNAGKNVLNGGVGADTMSGGLGDDTYIVDNSGDVVIEAVGGGTDLVQSSAASFQLGANVENLVLTGNATINGTGNTLNNALFGNAGKNVLDGKAGADTMAGGLGDDTYVVDNAGDVVTEAAGGGVDTVTSSVTWALGANLETLVLTGNAAIDGSGNVLANSLTGNVGNNVLDGGAGADTMAGGRGNDTYVVDHAGDLVVELEGGGVDTVLSSLNWTLGANVERLTLSGTAHRSGTGNGLNNTLTGNAGNNLLDGGAGADTMAGGLGDDTYVVDEAGDVAVEEAGAGTDTVQSSVTWRLRANFEKLVLTGSANVNGTGNELNNTLTGNAGNNLLDGGAGADRMAGGLGDDTYIVDASTDTVTEGADAGLDTVRATASHRLSANVENLTLLGAAHLNGTGNGLANVLTGNAGNNTLDGAGGADTMAGGLGHDVYVVDDAGDVVIEASGAGTDTVQAWVSHVLSANVESLRLMGDGDLDGTGNSLANKLFGNGGANLLDGGAGADTMTGGDGDDTYVVDHAGDRVIETAGGGADTVRSSVAYKLGAGVETLVLTGNAVSGKGNGENNALVGNGANNVLDGGAGADTMTGGAGDDLYTVDDAGDVVVELAGGGQDTVQAWVSHVLGANVEKLKLLGAGDIDATGNGLANVLTGNGGHNVLDGGLGADTLNGGGGGDAFRFATALGDGNVDRIVSFDHLADTIQLDHGIFAGLGLGTLDAGAFNLGTVATQADDRILFHAGSKSLYYDADGLGGAEAVQFATIGTLKGGLDHTDFLVV